MKTNFLEGLIKPKINIATKLNMFNTEINNTTNHNYRVEKGGVLNLFVITDMEVAREMLVPVYFFTCSFFGFSVVRC